MAKDTVKIPLLTTHPSVRGAIRDYDQELRELRNAINRLIELSIATQDRVRVLEVLAGI